MGVETGEGRGESVDEGGGLLELGRERAGCPVLSGVSQGRRDQRLFLFSEV